MKLIDKDALVAEIEKLDALYHTSKSLDGDLFIQGLYCFLDTMQKEPTEVKHKKCIYALNDFNDEDRKVLCDGCEEDCKYNKKEVVNNKLGGINNALVQDRLITSKPIGVPADAVELINIPDKKEFVSKDLEKVIKEYYNSRREYGGRYNAIIPIYKSQLEDIAYYFAKWQKQQTISKACEWLNKNFTFIHPRKGVPVCAVNLNSFKDALNDEEV